MAKPSRVRGLGPRTPLSLGAEKLIAARRSDVQTLALRLSQGPDPVVVHDLRVAVRRLRAALDLFDRSQGTLGRRAKRLQDALGMVRDLQVEIAWLESLDRLGLGSLIAELHDRVSEHERTLEAQLGTWTPDPAPANGHAAGHGRLGGEKMRRVLAQRLGRLQKRLKRLQSSFSARDAHRARIAVKKLRYTSELLGAAFPRAASILRRELVPLQRELGDLHDADVWLSRWSAETSQRNGDLRETARAVADAAGGRRREAMAEVERDLVHWREAHVAKRVGRLLEGG
jgi:CHAD domain-containing protein